MLNMSSSCCRSRASRADTSPGPPRAVCPCSAACTPSSLGSAVSARTERDASGTRCTYHLTHVHPCMQSC